MRHETFNASLTTTTHWSGQMLLMTEALSCSNWCKAYFVKHANIIYLRKQYNALHSNDNDDPGPKQHFCSQETMCRCRSALS